MATFVRLRSSRPALKLWQQRLELRAQRAGKYGFLRCGYIGWYDQELAYSRHWHEPVGSWLRSRERFSGLPFSRVERSRGGIDWDSGSLEDLEGILQRHSSTTGAFIVDAYQAAYLGEEAVAGALQLCHENGVVTIVDETKTAGRSERIALGWELGWRADLWVLGKAIANGAPLSVLVGDEGLSTDAIAARITGTYSKELLGVYAALSTLEIMSRREGFVEISRIGREVADTIDERTSENAGLRKEGGHGYAIRWPLFGADI